MNVMVAVRRKVEEFEEMLFNLPEKMKTAITGILLAGSFLCGMACVSVIDQFFDLVSGFLWLIGSILLFLPARYVSEFMVLDDDDCGAWDDEEEDEAEENKIIDFSKAE